MATYSCSCGERHRTFDHDFRHQVSIPKFFEDLRARQVIGNVERLSVDGIPWHHLILGENVDPFGWLKMIGEDGIDFVWGTSNFKPSCVFIRDPVVATEFVLRFPRR